MRNLTCFCFFVIGLCIQAKISSAAAPKLTYPTVKKDSSAVDTYFEKKVPNPFKWLSTADEKAKTKFMTDQTSATTSYLSQIPSSDRKSIEKYIKLYEHETFLHFLTPFRAGDQYFFHDQFENKVFIQKGTKEKPSLLLSSESDSTKLPGGRIQLMKPSPTAETVAYAFSTCYAFVCYNTMKFKTVATKKDLTDTLYNVSSIMGTTARASIAWNPDGSGIYYMSNTTTPAETRAKAANEKKTYIFYHSMGTSQADDVLIAEIPREIIYSLKCSEDGQFLVAIYDPTVLLMISHIPPKDLENKPKESGSAYVLELCGKGKAPCKHTSKDKKLKVNKICTGGSVLTFLGNVGAELYFQKSCRDYTDSSKIVSFDLANSKHKDWKLVNITDPAAQISAAAMLNSEFLIVASSSYTGKPATILYNLKDKSTKTVPITYSKVLCMTIGRKDTKVILHTKSLLSSDEVYVMDASQKTLKAEKLQLPGSATDPFRDNIKYVDLNYTSHGSNFQILVMHGKDVKKDGSAPMLMLLDLKATATSSIRKLFIPFMEAFNGIIAIAEIEISVNQHSATPPTTTSIESAVDAIEFLIKEKYTDQTRLTLVPGSNAFACLIGVLINQRPDLFGAALLVDPNAPTTGIIDMKANNVKWIIQRSAKKLDLNSFYKDKETTTEYVEISPISNIKAPKDKKAEYPAVLLIDIGTEDAMRYIAQLQSEVGKQVKPLLAKFPVAKADPDKFVEDSEVEQYADIFSFLTLSLNYKVAK